MPTIKETISEYEADILMMIAENWGMDMEIDPGKDLAGQMSRIMVEKDNISEIVETLPQSAKNALAELIESSGRLPWERFTNKFGDIREIGAARREKEHPGRNPVSEAERLYYFGLIGRAFFDSGGGPKEFAFVPDELLITIQAAIPKKKKKSRIPLAKRQRLMSTEPDDQILDDAVTLLAELRKDPDLDTALFPDTRIPAEFLRGIFISCGIIGQQGHLDSSRIKEFLELERPAALLFLAKAWKESSNLNELNFLENIEIEGGWKNDPAHCRNQILKILGDLPEGKWIRFQDFISWVQDHYPDFLRNQGDFESWLIFNPGNGEYLRGFENWNNVEGRYLQFFIDKACFWYMLVELGQPPESENPTHFRVTSHLKKIYKDEPPEYQFPKKQFFIIEETGRLMIDRYFHPDARYQIARFAELTQRKRDAYIYRITPSSLERMKVQELKISQLLSLMKRFGKKPVPENIPAALKRWDARKTEAGVEKATILRVEEPELLDKLISSDAEKFILRRISPTDAIIKKDSEEIIHTALLRMGILAEINPEV